MTKGRAGSRTASSAGYSDSAVVRAPRSRKSVTWLTFFGHPTLIRGGRRRVLSTRYRKGLILLAFLAMQPERPQRRERLAELLLPGLELTAGRRNLRVLVSHLQSVLTSLKLDGVLQAERSWLVFHPSGWLLTVDCSRRLIPNVY